MSELPSTSNPASIGELPSRSANVQALPLLLRVKSTALRNRIHQTVDEAPIRVSVAVFLVAVIWYGLYVLFRTVFSQLERTPLEATVAIPLIFNFFFIAILALLILSNAIILYGALFGHQESSFLLTLPLHPQDLVCLKYVESLFFSSWSLVLLGLPLMLAIAHQTDRPEFYGLFIAFFLTFIPIPAALGALLAWAAARFLPRRAAGVLALIAGGVLAAFIVTGLRNMRVGDLPAEVWLRSFLTRMSFVESAFLPNHWVASGIDHALHGQMGLSLLYLSVTFANALFLSWLAVVLVSRRFDKALDRVTSGRTSGTRPASPASGGFSGLVFFYLPRPLRLIAAKDLRTFFRDPLQWSQLAILFGLLVLYLSNIPTLRLDLTAPLWGLLIPFLHLCAVSLILATFTCRFVFPLVSLEGRQLWLLGVLPLRRTRILWAKFAFAMTVTVLVAVSAVGFGSAMIELSWPWTMLHLLVTIATCFGLCGFSVGLGARFPMFQERNPARIANGIGGTINLLASLVLVTLLLSTVGYATWRARGPAEKIIPDLISVLLCLASILTALLAGTLAMRAGAHHFDRVEV